MPIFVVCTLCNSGCSKVLCGQHYDICGNGGECILPVLLYFSALHYYPPKYGTGVEASRQGNIYSFEILVLKIFIARAHVDEIFKYGDDHHHYIRRVLPGLVTQILTPIFLSELDEPTGDYNNSTNQRHRNKLLEYRGAIIRFGVTCSVASPLEGRDMQNLDLMLRLLAKDLFFCPVQGYIYRLTGQRSSSVSAYSLDYNIHKHDPYCYTSSVLFCTVHDPYIPGCCCTDLFFLGG